MSNPGVKVVATKEGLKIEGIGFSGSACSLAVGEIARELGIPPEQIQNKPAYFEGEIDTLQDVG
jgi:hypothetical protein